MGTASGLLLIYYSPAIRIDILHNASAPFQLRNPGLISIPLSFAWAWPKESRTRISRAWQRFSVYDLRVQSQFPRRHDLRCARIDGDYFALAVDQLLRECPVSATQVEDALAGQGCQHLQDWRAEIGNEAGMARVRGGIPGLR